MSKSKRLIGLSPEAKVRIDALRSRFRFHVPTMPQAAVARKAISIKCRPIKEGRPPSRNDLGDAPLWGWRCGFGKRRGSGAWYEAKRCLTAPLWACGPRIGLKRCLWIRL